ncbi:low affinity Fe/Cu permease [Cryobacterium psychrotolerans]|nr:low affinity Fe/Cu permease [Cryobacterium psychrotolerans]MEC5151318.1 low affinity Fe/Cu permease [Cryobacterium psychrotolerans]
MTATITLVMVFVIQHTQARQQAATQRKLDELLRALPTADNRLIAVEAAPDKELDDLADRNLTHREQAVHNATPQP